MGTTCLPTPHPNLTGIVLISGAAGLKLYIYAYPRRICLFFSDVQTYGGVPPPPDMTTKNFSPNKVFAEKEFLPKKNLLKKYAKKCGPNECGPNKCGPKIFGPEHCFAEEKKI